VTIPHMSRGVNWGRFNRLFLVAAVIWFVCAAFLPWKWSNMARQHELADMKARFASCYQAVEFTSSAVEQNISDKQNARLELLDSGAPSPSEKKIRDQAAKEFHDAYEIERQRKRLCDDAARRENRDIAQRHADAWKAVFPKHTIWCALALLILPPGLAYGILIGLGKLAIWVWRGSTTAK